MFLCYSLFQIEVKYRIPADMSDAETLQYLPCLRHELKNCELVTCLTETVYMINCFELFITLKIFNTSAVQDTTIHSTVFPG